MANIRKSFNFRNGVQVDVDNFIVNADGLVGVAKTNPTELLDVAGNVKAEKFIGDFLDVTNSEIDFENVGVSTITQADITSAQIDFENVGVSTITQADIDFETVGLSTITQADIDFEIVGLSTITQAVIQQADIEFETVGVSTITRADIIDAEIDNLNVTGITTTQKLHVGTAGTTLLSDSTTGRTGIGSTTPRVKFDVVGTAAISDRLGIGNADPQQDLDITGVAIVSDKLGVGNVNPQQDLDITGVAVVSDKLGVGNNNPRQELDVTGTALVSDRVGINTSSPKEELDVIGTALVSNRIGIGNTNPEQRLDVAGSVKIDEFIYDSANSPGENGYYLNMDETGVRWIQGTPNFTEGIYVQDDGTYIPTVGLAQSFTVLNFKNINSLGVGTETVVSIPNPGNPTFVADVQSKDLWGYNSSGEIYRLTNVGIGISNPEYDLDVDGVVRLRDALRDFNNDPGSDGQVLISRGDGVVWSNNSLESDSIRVTEDNENIERYVSFVEDISGVTSVRTSQKFIYKPATSLFAVGQDKELFNVEELPTTDVRDLEGNLIKQIKPIAGVGVDSPTRTLDVAGDLRVRGEVIDSNNNVGFAYSVLGSSGTPGITGRFIDGANLLIRNKEFIANEVVGFITSVDGPFGSNGVNFDYGSAGLTNGPTKCKRDIGLIIDSIAFDISKGGNSKSVGAGLSYYAGNVLQHLDDSSPIPSGLSAGYVKTATISAIDKIKDIAQYAINNVQYPTSYQYGPYYNRYSDAANLLESNKDFIAQYAVAKLLNDNPAFTIPTGNDTCIRDIKLVLDAIIYNLRYTGNDRVWDAANLYAENDYLLGEESESVEAYLNARDAAISVMRNELVNTSGISAPYSSIITAPQIVDGSIIVDPSSPKCANVASSIATFVGIVTQAINTQDISNIPRTPAIEGVSQYIDLELAPDGDSNTNILGCANVLSAIHSCVGIVTTILNSGPSAAPNITYPSGKLTWQPPGPRIGNEWFVNKLGDDTNGGTGPGDAFLTIKKAASVAEPGDTIRVYAGLYIEDGPISLNERVAVVGEDLRRTLVTTRDKTDLFYVKRGCYVAQMSFVGESNPGKAMVSFPTQGYGYADGTEENWQSPYVQNCTNFVPESIGMRIDGSRAGGFKSMVLDAFTQYNQGGIGVSITNFGYAQLVSLFTICCDTAVYCDTGGYCDMNNSNSSFGNYGLWATGTTPLQYTGTIAEDPTQGGTVDNIDSLVINVGVGASDEFVDSVTMLRANKDFIASEVVGFITSTSSSQVMPGIAPPFPGVGNQFDYGGSEKGREFCKRDSKIIIEQICSDILTLGNKNSIEAGLAYRDSADGSLTYLGETTPPPVGFNTGYVKDAEIAAIRFISGISTYIVRNQPVPFSFQAGIGSQPQVFLTGISTSSAIDSFISNRVGIITSIIGIGTTAAPALVLPKGQRPYDGQVAVIDTQYYFVSSVNITNGGSGYTPGAPVGVEISLPPGGPDIFTPAELAIFETNVNDDGSIGSIDILVSGTGYSLSSPPTITIDPPPGVGVRATAEPVLEKLYFTPTVASQVSAGGTTTVTFDEFITYPIGVGDTVYFYHSSKIIASSITFEYVGTGINIVNAIPSKGAVPIDENQVTAINGGKVPFTSTDQSGDFRISEDLTINQNTGTISGQAFSKSLQAEVTPLIIALQ